MRKLLTLLISFCLVLSLAGCGNNAKISHTISDVILYTFNTDGMLEYNAIHSAAVSADVKVHGCDINSPDSLAAIMGTADMPAEKLTASVSDRTLGKAVTANLGFDSENNIVDIEVTAVNERPVIGISWKSENIKSDYHNFAQILERNGAYAVYLPEITDSDKALQVLGDIDGVVLTGGRDINPALYGEKQTPHGAVSASNTRDTSDLLLARHAIETDTPLIAICRGLQVLNVSLGGGLIQDISYNFGQQVLAGEIPANRVTEVVSGRINPDDIPVADPGYDMYDENGKKTDSSYNAETGKYTAESGCEEGHLMVEVDNILHRDGSHYHSITVDAESRWLYKITGSKDVPYVATYHHQAINPDNIGDGLTVVAYAPDGTIEAVEYQDNTFALGLQYHPEKDALKDHTELDVVNDECNEYFLHLVRYALQHSQQ